MLDKRLIWLCVAIIFTANRYGYWWGMSLVLIDMAMSGINGFYSDWKADREKND